jgi:tripartite-type tricarboxylate transporter receptor subunit TctC
MKKATGEDTMIRASLVVAVAAAEFLLLRPAGAQSVEEFYRGKTILLQMGSAPGGGYDVVGRLVARYMRKYIPGQPAIVPQNVPGGGSLVLANQFANITKRDGTVFGLMSNGMATTPLLDPGAAKFDPRKFKYLGSTSRESEVLVVWHTAGVRTIDDLFNKEIIMGASSAGSATHDFPYLLNALLGTKFKIVLGYSGATDVKLAMERGEVEGNAALAWGSAKTQYADVLKSGKLRVIAQYGNRHDKDFPDVPTMPQGKTESARQMLSILYAREQYGRPFLTPPDVPDDRVAALRTAFEQTIADKDFRADAEKSLVDVDFVSGKELVGLTDEVFRTPPDVVEKLRALLKAK